MDFQYVYIKKRSEFGRQCFFNSEPGALTCDIPPDREQASKFLHVNPVHRGTQVGCEMSAHEVCTDRAEFATTGINHAEGGWSKDINASDVEQTSRFKKKVEKEETYLTSVLQLGSMMEHCIKQNNTLDIYEEYFGGQDSVVTGDDTIAAKTLNVFRDPCPQHRSACCLSWSPDATRLAAAYTSLRFQSSANNLPVESFVWDVENPSRPDYTMSPPDCLVSLEFNPKESFVIAGGTYRGRVCWFDRRRGPQPIEISSLDASHSDPVYSTIWVNSKSGTELFTASTDGKVLWWDTRKLTEPTETLILDVNKNQEPQLRRAQGATVLEYETTIPTKFMLGTEQGTVITCNRKGKTQAEKISAVYQAHLGPVRQVQRNPAFLKTFLTIGDWCAKVWSEECKESAILWTDSGEVQLTGGSWSPTRPSVFFTSKSDGTVDAWDILYQQRAPVLTIQVGDSPLETLRVQEAGVMLAAGSADGQITLLQLSDGLVTSQKNDRLVLTALFERETRREKILEGKNREARLQKKMKSEGSGVSKQSSLVAPQLTASARLEKENTEVELIEEAQKNFFETVYKEKAARQEKQKEEMAAKGVVAELDSVEFQAPDLSGLADSDSVDGTEAKPSAASAVEKKSSIAAKTSSTAAAKTSSTAAAKTSSTAAAKTSSTVAAKTSSSMASKKSSTVAAKASGTSKKSSTVVTKQSSTATATETSATSVEPTSADVTSADTTSADATSADATTTDPTTVTEATSGADTTPAGETTETDAESMVTAETSENPDMAAVISVASKIADVVDDLEEAVDELLDNTETETEATSPGDEQTTDS